MKNKDRVAQEALDICGFCKDLWGMDKRDACVSICTCASYINQDYVPLKAKTVGLAVNGPDEGPTVPAKPYLEALPKKSLQRVAQRIGDLAKTLEPGALDVLTMLIQGASRDEICKAKGIRKETYYQYINDILEESAKIEAKKGN